MKDRDEARDEMSERLGQRFDSDDTDDKADKSDKSDKPDKDDKDDKEVKQDKQTMETKQDKSAKDYKEVWGSKLMHLPDELLDPVDDEFDRIQYETDWKVKKEQHYYPVVVSRGIGDVEDMSGEEFTDAVESLDLR